MAKPFGKVPGKWLELPSTKDFLNQLTTIRKSDSLIHTIEGRGGGTWFHEDVAIEKENYIEGADYQVFPKNGENQRVKVVATKEILGREVRVFGTFEEPLFLAQDVAEWIKHSDVSMMIRNLEQGTEKVTNIVCTPGGNQAMSFVTEDGLYEVLMLSRKPIAKQWKKLIKAYLKDLRKYGIATTKDCAVNVLQNPQ